MDHSRHLGLVCVALVALVGCDTDSNAHSASNPDPQLAPNSLTANEIAAGWTLLFDGRSFDGWRGLGRASVPPEHWIIEDTSIRKVASGEVPTAPDDQPLEGGDIMTLDTYRDFELAFEWKVSPGAHAEKCCSHFQLSLLPAPHKVERTADGGADRSSNISGLPLVPGRLSWYVVFPPVARQGAPWRHAFRAQGNPSLRLAKLVDRV